MQRRILCITLVFAILGGFNQAICQSQIINQDKDNLILKDSLGNIITYEKSIELLRTGEYISVPSMNEFMQLEHVIRKSKKEDGDKYKTFTDGDIVLNTIGLTKASFRFNPGDTVPAFQVSDRWGGQTKLDDLDKVKSNLVLLFIEENNSIWRYDLRPYLKSLSAKFRDVGFIICPGPQADYNLAAYFNNRDLKKMNNIFIAEKAFSEQVSVDHFPTYVALTKSRNVKFSVPSQVPTENVFTLLDKYLSSVK